MTYGYGEGDNRVPALIDMINGGGPGMAGQKFEDGGLFSAIANMLASPYGSEDRRNAMQSNMAAPPARPAGVSRGPSAPPPQASMNGTGMTPSNAYVQPPQQGTGMNPGNAYMPPQSPPMGSGMNPGNAYAPPSQPMQQPQQGQPALPPMGSSQTPGSQYHPMEIARGFEMWKNGLAPADQQLPDRVLRDAYSQFMSQYPR